MLMGKASRYFAIFLFPAVVLFLPAPAQDLHSVEDKLRAEFQDKVLTFRHFPCGSRLHLRADGSLVDDQTCPSWTTHGRIRVDRLSLGGNGVHIKAHRLFLAYDLKSERFFDILQMQKGDPLASQFRPLRDKDGWKKVTKASEVQLDIESPAESSLSGFEGVFGKIFSAPGAPLSEVVPDYWQAVVRKDEGDRSWKAPASARAVGKVGPGVNHPNAIFQPDPAYSQTAREAGYEGTLVLWLIVEADGKPGEIQVARPLGLGLDDQAVAAVRTWKFEPATKDGVPVPVQINVEVTFRMY